MTNPFEKLMGILDQFDHLRIDYSLTRVREDSIMIEAPAPGQRWEIEVMGDGTVEVEVFRSDGKIFDDGKIKELIECYTDRIGLTPADEVTGELAVSSPAGPKNPVLTS